MPRRTRFIIPQLPHHAIQRGNNKQSVFFEAHDRTKYLELLKEYSFIEEVKVGAYCLMTNHVHLLLYPKTEAGLIRMMKMINQLYSQYINKRYKRTGKLWENRYKLHLAESGYDWAIARYIERNPLRAKMVKEAANYPYSSGKAHLQGVVDAVLTCDILEGKTREYREYFQDVNADNEQGLAWIRMALNQGKVMGGEAFIRKLEERWKECFSIRRRGRPFKLNK